MSTKIDLLHRADPVTLPEWMDEPSALETMRGCLQSLEQVNRLSFGYRPTLAFLERALARARTHGLAFTPARPMRILDVGSGGGDMLCRIARWAAVRRIPVALTGVDLNPQAALLARETEQRTRSNHPRLRSTPITWLTADALTLTLPTPPDLILSALFMHHLRDGEIVRVLQWQHRTATLGWFVNDLARSARAATAFLLLARLLRWHPFVQHDGPVSFRRAFRPADWHALLAAAGISGAHLLPTPPGRLCVEHLR